MIHFEPANVIKTIFIFTTRKLYEVLTVRTPRKQYCGVSVFATDPSLPNRSGIKSSTRRRAQGKIQMSPAPLESIGGGRGDRTPSPDCITYAGGN